MDVCVCFLFCSVVFVAFNGIKLDAVQQRNDLNRFVVLEMKPVADTGNLSKMHAIENVVINGALES